MNNRTSYILRSFEDYGTPSREREQPELKSTLRDCSMDYGVILLFWSPEK
jgi:hypothetical protein